MPRHPEHLPTFSYIGPHRYSLRFSTHHRQRAFTNEDAVALVWEHIQQRATELGFAVLAYCFMPDHVHLLIEGLTEASDCRHFISRAKQFSGFYYARRFGGRLWQRYGYERVLRSDEATEVVMRNILANPLRAGLVDDVRDYPYLGSSICAVHDLIAGL